MRVKERGGRRNRDDTYFFIFKSQKLYIKVSLFVSGSYLYILEGTIVYMVCNFHGIIHKNHISVLSHRVESQHLLLGTGKKY